MLFGMDHDTFKPQPPFQRSGSARGRRTVPLVGVMALLVGAGACTRPVSLREKDVLTHIAKDYRAFFPAGADPDPGRDVGLLRPRFGLPAILSADERADAIRMSEGVAATSQAAPSFEVEVLERGGPGALRLVLGHHELSDAQLAACAAEPQQPVPGCYPLRVVSARREPVTPDTAHAFLTVEPIAPLPPRDYDLYVTSQEDAPTRAPRAVWLRGAGSSSAPLRIAHLSDLHIGKNSHGHLYENLERVLVDVNAGAPDLVVLTGDIANMGTRARLEERAREILLRINAPVLAIMGNHDHGFGRMLFRTRYGAGWSNFARAFHPSLLYSLTLDGWEFIGFDSGPSEFSARVLTRGLAPETLAVLEEKVRAAHTAGRRGVILFSHAPSRASLTTATNSEKPGPVGRMYRGARAFETVLLNQAPGMRLIHLAGHTHWSDLYEAHAKDGEVPARFVRWAPNALTPCLSPLSGRVALITTQSATHTTFPLRKNGQGYGFTWLHLDDERPRVAFQRYRGPAALECSIPGAAPLTRL